MGAGIISVVVLFLKMHGRLLKIEAWIKFEGEKADRAMNILDTISTALTRVAVLYEAMEGRMNRLENNVDEHHKNLNIHHIHGQRR